MNSQFIKSYKELEFWKRSKEVSLLVVELTRRLPRERPAWVITDQLIRSSFSVGANIAEGFGKFKGKEYNRFIRIALGSANETEYWLEMAKDIYPNNSKIVNQVLDKNKETIKMLTTTLKSLNKRN